MRFVLNVIMIHIVKPFRVNVTRVCVWKGVEEVKLSQEQQNTELWSKYIVQIVLFKTIYFLVHVA